MAHLCFYFKVVPCAWSDLSQYDTVLEVVALKYQKATKKGKVECFFLNNIACIQGAR